MLDDLDLKQEKEQKELSKPKEKIVYNDIHSKDSSTFRYVAMVFMGVFLLFSLVIMSQSAVLIYLVFQQKTMSTDELKEKIILSKVLNTFSVEPLKKKQNEIVKIEHRIEQLQNDLSSLNKLYSKLEVSSKSKQQEDFIIYRWQEKDTLWGVAKKNWGWGKLYPVLLETNGFLNIHSNRIGQKIKILKNKKKVQRIYKKVIVKANQKRYMRYNIKEEDNWDILSLRFYGDIKYSNSMKKKYKRLIPNKRILLALRE